MEDQGAHQPQQAEPDVFVKLTAFTLRMIPQHIRKRARVIGAANGEWVNVRVLPQVPQVPQGTDGCSAMDIFKLRSEDVALSEDAVFNGLRGAEVRLIGGRGCGSSRVRRVFFASLRTLSKDRALVLVSVEPTLYTNSGVMGKTLFQVELRDLGPIQIPFCPELSVTFATPP